MKPETPQSIVRWHKVATITLVLVLAGSWLYVNWNEPASFYTVKYDPEFPYFMNSLAVFKGKPYTYIEHPGIPLELLGTGLLALTYPFIQGTSDTFVMYHLSRPELFLTLVRAFLSLFGLICVFLLSRHSVRIKHWTDAFFSIAVAATFFVLLSPLTFDSLTYWSHNSFNFPFGTLLLLLLLMRLRSNQEIRWWEISLFGIGAGILTAVTIYHATWVIGIAAAICISDLLKQRRWQKIVLSGLIVGISSILGFIAATIPMVKRYRYFLWWVKSLIIHQKRYGRGETGITSLDQLQENFAALWSDAPILFISLSLTIALIFITLLIHRRKLNQNPGLWGIALGLSVQSIGTFLVILKHYGRHYLLAVAAILPLLLSAVYSLLSQSSPRARRTFVVLGSIIIFGFAYGFVEFITEHKNTVSDVYLMEAELSEYKTNYSLTSGKNPESLSILWGYGVGSRCFALRFGDFWAGNAFSKEIPELCPNDGLYDVWSDQGKLTTNKEWDIIIVPKRHLPNDAGEYGTVIISDAETTRYGKVVFIISTNDK